LKKQLLDTYKGSWWPPNSKVNPILGEKDSSWLKDLSEAKTLCPSIPPTVKFNSEYGPMRASSPFLIWEALASYEDSYSASSEDIQRIVLSYISGLVMFVDTKPFEKEFSTQARAVVLVNSKLDGGSVLCHSVRRFGVYNDYSLVNTIYEVYPCSNCARYDIKRSRIYLREIKDNQIPLCSCPYDLKVKEGVKYMNIVQHIYKFKDFHHSNSIRISTLKRRPTLSGKRIKWDVISGVHPIERNDPTATRFLGHKRRNNFYATLFRLGIKKHYKKPTKIHQEDTPREVRFDQPGEEWLLKEGYYEYDMCRDCMQYVSQVNPCSNCGFVQCYHCSGPDCLPTFCAVLAKITTMKLDPNEDSVLGKQEYRPSSRVRQIDFRADPANKEWQLM